MPHSKIRSHSDPTETVDLQNPASVVHEIDAIMRERFGKDYRASLIEQGASDLARAFAGNYPGLLRCDTSYHDLRHALDTGLLMARLIAGHGMTTRPDAVEHIDSEHAVLCILLAFYHDIGLLRRSDEANLRGAELTPVHEERGVVFMRDYLGQTPLAHLADKSDLIMVTKLVWHMPPDMPALDQAMASLLGAADIMSQLSDRAYLEKCRDFLFAEFSIVGLAGFPDSTYPDPKALLEKTPGFYTHLICRRMESEYGGADRFTKIFFGGVCPYAAAIKRNLDYLGNVLEKDDLSRLRRQPVRIVDAV